MGFGASRDVGSKIMKISVREEATAPRSGPLADVFDGVIAQVTFLQVPAGDANAHEMTTGHGDGYAEQILISVDSVLPDSNFTLNTVANQFTPTTYFPMPTQGNRRHFSSTVSPSHDTAVIDEFDVDEWSGAPGDESGTEWSNHSSTPTTVRDAFSSVEDNYTQQPPFPSAQYRHHHSRGPLCIAEERVGDAFQRTSLTAGPLPRGSSGRARIVGVPIDVQELSGKSQTASRSVDASLRVRYEFSTSRGAAGGASSFSASNTLDSHKGSRYREGAGNSFSENVGDLDETGSFVRGSVMTLPQFGDVDGL